MDLKEIAAELVAGCRENRTIANLDSLYAADAVSVEASDPMGKGRETHGVNAIRGKHEWWAATAQVHSASVSDPMLHGDDRFAVIFAFDATMTDSGQRMQLTEVGIYHVAHGKIVREEFYY